jgi:hypothetical protein
VGLHVYTFAAEADAFSFEPQALFDGIISTQLDMTARAKDSLPGQTKGSMQYPHYVSRVPWQSCRTSDCAIS